MFGDFLDVWSWSGVVGEVIEVVEGDVVEDHDEDGDVEVDGSAIGENWIEAYPMAVAMQKEHELVTQL